MLQLHKIFNKLNKSNIHQASAGLRAFTLIELLVVIAIIAILSSIILASLSNAQGGGNNAKVEEQLNSLRTGAEIYYNANGGYMTSGTYTGGGTGNDTACSTGGGTGTFTNTFLSDATSGSKTVIQAIAATANVVSIQCSLNTTGYVVVANLPSAAAANPFWCVDSVGHSKAEPTISAFTGTVCN